MWRTDQVDIHCSFSTEAVFTRPSLRLLADCVVPRVPLREGRRPGHRDRLLHPLHQRLRQAGPERVRPADRNHPGASPEEDLRLAHSGLTRSINVTLEPTVF